MPPNPIIHLYQPEFEHCAAVIACNEAGMMALRKLLNETANWTVQRDAISVFANDGEGYELVLVLLGDDETNMMPHPYLNNDDSAPGRWSEEFMGEVRARLGLDPETGMSVEGQA
jgi:hypothetical protein